jgi:hypothetical protein
MSNAACESQYSTIASREELDRSATTAITSAIGAILASRLRTLRAREAAEPL